MNGFPKKLPDGRWKHDFRVGGRGSPRKRGTFKTKIDALQFERREKTKFEGGTFERKSDRDNRTLNEFINDWYRLHGINLRYNEGTKRKLIAFSARINNPLAKDVTAKHFTDDRAERLADKLRPIKPNSVNNDLAYIKAMFNEMIRLGHWPYDNPVKSVKKLKLMKLSWAIWTWTKSVFYF